MAKKTSASPSPAGARKSVTGQKTAAAEKAAAARRAAAAGKKMVRPAAAEPSPEHIREAAYYRWLERGCPPGDAHSDWLEAEKRLREGK